ncbi:DUF5625 family protein [Humidesulfovibrio idahonensis]
MRNENIRWYVVYALLLLSLLVSVPKALFAETLPAPVVKFPFDLSKQSNVIKEDFQILETRSYIFAVMFAYSGEGELDYILGILGNATQPTTGKSSKPGIQFPLRLEIFKLVPGRTPESVYNTQVVTKGYYAHGFAKKHGDGSFSREIATIDLSPGVYHVEVATIEDRPILAGLPTYLVIDYHSQLRFLPHSK